MNSTQIKKGINFKVLFVHGLRTMMQKAQHNKPVLCTNLRQHANQVNFKFVHFNQHAINMTFYANFEVKTPITVFNHITAPALIEFVCQSYRRSNGAGAKTIQINGQALTFRTPR